MLICLSLTRVPLTFSFFIVMDLLVNIGKEFLSVVCHHIFVAVQEPNDNLFVLKFYSRLMYCLLFFSIIELSNLVLSLLNKS